MLKTNSKKARQNIIAYVKKYAAGVIAERGIVPENDNELLAAIWMICKAEKSYYFEAPGKYRHESFYTVFRDWAQGLAMGDLFCYYYNRQARDDLKNILEETDAEAARYTERDAEELLTRLIYREVIKGYENTPM